MAVEVAEADGSDLFIDTSHKWSEESICRNDLYLNILFDGKRVKWIETFELLKEFVVNDLKESGKWTLPGTVAQKGQHNQ